MNKILFIALTTIFSGYLIMNKSPESLTKIVLATNENSNTAKVSKVEVTGEPNNYTFAVTVNSPDTNCAF